MVRLYASFPLWLLLCGSCGPAERNERQIHKPSLEDQQNSADGLEIPEEPDPGKDPAQTDDTSGRAKPLPLTAYVYQGAATCGIGCTAAMVSLVESAGFTVVNKNQPPKNVITASDLEGVSLYVQPGGNADIDTDYQVVAEQTALISEFVNAGGRYLGSCTGAWLAMAGNEWQSNGPDYYSLISPKAGYYVELHNDSPHPIKVNDVDNHILPVVWEKLDGSKEVRDLLYAGGPYIVGARPASVVAWYPIKDPSTNHPAAAALVETVGLGKVAIAGPHPEATEGWYEDAPEANSMDYEIATDLALDLIERLGPWQ